MAKVDGTRLEAAIARLHDAPQMAYVVCTGAGAGVTELLWSVPGCSRTLIASEFPYDARAFTDLIGRVPAQYTSANAAIALAAAGYLKAQRYLVEAGKLQTPIVALGLTAAVSSDRVRRGEDRAFLAIRTATDLATVSATFERGQMSRAEEGAVCDALAINSLLWAAGLDQAPLRLPRLRSTEIDEAGLLQPAPVRLDLGDAELPVWIDEDGALAALSTLSPRTHVLFPGSFNPLHFGHDLFAQAVQEMTGKRAVFEIAAVNADKPGIGREALARRALQFRGRWPVLLSESLPLFIQKARAYGGFDFVVGLDTATRIFDPKYFGSEAARDAVVGELRALGVRFYVCNRGDDAGALERVVGAPRMAGLLVPVPMLVPVSSSDLRAEGAPASR